MSTKTLTEGNAPAYSDAERGLIDIHARPGTVLPAFDSQAPKYPTDEKKGELVPANFFPPPKEKESPKAAAPAPARPTTKKKKASKWVLWKLWFNTYR